MPYQEILLSLVDPNPFQTRKKFDEEILVGIATSSIDEIGIRNAPLIRPHPTIKGRYEIGSGHGRIQAVQKLLGKDKMVCRVESLTDSQMKKEVLVENVNRSDLTEEERMTALEQYREELGISLGDEGFFSKLSQATGIPHNSLNKFYKRKEVRIRLRFVLADDKEIPASLIDNTAGLIVEDQDKLIIKSLDKGWSSDTAFKVKTAIKDMNSEVRLKILDKDIDLTWKTIQNLTEIKDSDIQLETIKYIETHKLNEELALKFIDRIAKGEIPNLTVVRNEQQEVMDSFKAITQIIKGWGFNQFSILGEQQWQSACEIFTEIENHMHWLKLRKWEQ